MWVKVNLDKKINHPYLLNLDTGARIYCEDSGEQELNWLEYNIYYENLTCEQKYLLNVVWVYKKGNRSESPLNVTINNIFKKIKLGEHFEI